MRASACRELKQALAAAQTPPSKPAPGRSQIVQQVKTMTEALTSLQKTAPGATARFGRAKYFSRSGQQYMVVTPSPFRIEARRERRRSSVTHEG
jgi:hypothetical protein